MAKFNTHLSDESDQVSSTTATYLHVLLLLPLSILFIYSLLKTMWYQKYGCANKYHCASAIYLLSCISLEMLIIIDIEVGSPGHVKYFVGGLNYIYKWMLKLEMERLLNPELICDDTFSKFMQVY